MKKLFAVIGIAVAICVFGILGLALLGAMIGDSVAVSNQPSLALLSTTGGDGGYGYHVVNGEVKNLSAVPLKRVVAVVSWYDGGGRLITSDTAMVEYNPIMPGQTSPFKTMTRSNPLMYSFKMGFTQMGGGTLTVDDQRKPKY
jgi:hypothetical protein